MMERCERCNWPDFHRAHQKPFGKRFDEESGSANGGRVAFTSHAFVASVSRPSASEIMQDDMTALMKVLGISVHARPCSPHEVMVNEIIPAVRALLSCDVCLLTIPEDQRFAQCLKCFDDAQARHGAAWTCAARKQGTAGGNDPVDCDWPHCSCDPKADDVIAALQEEGRCLEIHPPTSASRFQAEQPSPPAPPAPVPDLS